MKESIKDRNILILNHYATRPNDPGGSRHYALARGLIKDGWKVTICASTFDHFLKKFKEGAFKEEYGGACPILGANPNQLRHWANSKNLSVMPELLLTELGIDEFPIKYWAGSSYSLGRGNTYKITQNKHVFDSFKNLMAGCEDLCVGTVVKKL